MIERDPVTDQLNAAFRHRAALRLQRDKEAGALRDRLTTAIDALRHVEPDLKTRGEVTREALAEVILALEALLP
jgi:hypothetical protein